MEKKSYNLREAREFVLDDNSDLEGLDESDSDADFLNNVAPADIGHPE